MLLEKTAAVGSEPGVVCRLLCLVTPLVHAYNTSHGVEYNSGSTSRLMVAQQPSSHNKKYVRKACIV